MKLTFIKKQHETGNAWSFFFHPSEPVEWTAGQFVKMTIEHDDMDDRKDERYFTISAAPHEKDLRVTTRINKSRSSFKDALFELKKGDVVTAAEPDGEFTIDKPKEHHVLIAGGIGITPYRSILVELAHQKEPINATLLYANSNSDIVFQKELENLTEDFLNFNIHYFTGGKHIDKEVITKLVPHPTESIFMVSGPEPMVESMCDMLLEMDLEDTQIKRDYFPGYSWPESDS